MSKSQILQVREVSFCKCISFIPQFSLLRDYRGGKTCAYIAQGPNKNDRMNDRASMLRG